MNFDIAYQILLPALQKIVELTHSYGWAIILLTVAFRLLVSPLVTQTTVSMRRMSKLQPQMKAIQERYKSNPEQLQKKLMEFYSKNKINPMGGCLPTLIQLPLLFALYATFAGPPFTDKILDIKVDVVSSEKAQTQRHADAASGNSIYISKEGVPAKVVAFPGNSTIAAGDEINFGARAIEGKLDSSFTPEWRIVLPANHETKEATINLAKEQTEAYIEPSGHAVFPKTGEYHIQAVIPGIAKNESFGFITGLGKIATGANLLNPANFDIIVLVLLFGATMFLSQKLTVPTPKPADGKELDEQQIIQQQTMKTMPIVTTGMFFFFPIPAGVYLYLVVSNVLQTFQTWLITRMPEPEFIDVGEDHVVLEAEVKGATGKNGRSGSNGNGRDAMPQNKKKTKRKKK